MNQSIKNKLLKIAAEKIVNDPSHDFNHAVRTLNLATEIGKREGADFDILVPAALFHDVIVYRKDIPASKNEANESAELAEKILKKIKEFPRKKIAKVLTAIRHCSFSKGIRPDFLEAAILQDADRLEATGAISIMRTFSSGGQMNRPLYGANDPFCKKRRPSFEFALDLFFNRLLVVEKGMHTKYAKKLARGRTVFLKKFLKQLKLELKNAKILN
jgi:uncharacterized protein